MIVEIRDCVKQLKSIYSEYSNKTLSVLFTLCYATSATQYY